MASRSHRTPSWPALWASALALVLAALPAGAAGDDPPGGDAPGGETDATATQSVRTVIVGKAQINLRLAPAASAKRAALVAAFEQATEARLTGGEPWVTPRAEPVTLPGGQLMLALPAELMHTMFVGPAGRSFCSDSTVTATKASANADGEGR